MHAQTSVHGVIVIYADLRVERSCPRDSGSTQAPGEDLAEASRFTARQTYCLVMKCAAIL